MPSTHLTIISYYNVLTEEAEDRQDLNDHSQIVSVPAVEGETAQVVEDIHNHHDACAHPTRVQSPDRVALHRVSTVAILCCVILCEIEPQRLFQDVKQVPHLIILYP
jgi:hypothetical protein